MYSMRHPGHGRFSDDELENTYPFPMITRSMEEADRHRHEDLTTLSDEELRRQARLARHRADRDPDDERRAWLEQRIKAIEAEQRRRLVALHAELRRLERGQ
jgi:hypothetical protein